MKAYRSSVLVVSAVVSSACSVDRTTISSSAIIGGTIAGPNEFPSTGMLLANNTLVCTATLIAPDVALTAAHCLTPPLFGAFAFTLDPDASDGTDDVVPVRFTHQHPDFDHGVNLDLAVRNDIGVIILDRPIVGVQPATFDSPLFHTTIDSGNQLSVCGYGRALWYTGAHAQKRDAVMFVDRIESHEFSTTPSDPQPCIGDSGAPLFIDDPDARRIVGVVSRAVGASDMCDTGAIITRVGPYAQWIRDASNDRDAGCSAGGGASLLPLGALGVLRLRRRRPPR